MVPLQRLIAIYAVASVGASPLQAVKVSHEPLRSLSFPLNHTFSHILAMCLDIPLPNPVPIHIMIPLQDPIPVIINIPVQDPVTVIIKLKTPISVLNTPISVLNTPISVCGFRFISAET